MQRTPATTDQVGFEDFFRTEYPGLVRSAYLLTADRAEAEELAQEAMARVFERWDRVAGMRSPGGYVYRIVVNLNRRRIRHLGVRVRRLAEALRGTGESPSGHLRSELAGAIEKLSRGQREALMLVEWVGLSSEEAARVLGIKPASVRSRVHRARSSLRELLGEVDDDG